MNDCVSAVLFKGSSGGFTHTHTHSISLSIQIDTNCSNFNYWIILQSETKLSQAKLHHMPKLLHEIINSIKWIGFALMPIINFQLFQFAERLATIG